MADWLRRALSHPFDAPLNAIAYLSMPVIWSAALASATRRDQNLVLIPIAVGVSLVALCVAGVMLYGVHSTLGIGVMFALPPFTIASIVTIALVRTLQRMMSR